MGVAFKAFGHVGHFGPRCAVAAHLAVLVISLAHSFIFLPAGNKLAGALLSCFSKFLLRLHGEDGAPDLSVCGFMRERLIRKIGTLHVA